jgi:PAS domain S-box-containing protein
LKRTTFSERALVLAPLGRDASIAVAVLGEAGIGAEICASLTALLDQLDRGAAFVVVTEEALANADLKPLAAWIADQEEWSDLPFVLLTGHGGALERNPAAKRYLDVLGNVTFIERPFHPTTLVSLAQAALRGRRRQYEARARLEALHESEQRYRTLFDTIDEGFCVIEFLDGPHGPSSDYVHVEANPAYARHAGISDVVGRTVREMVPDEAAGWIELYRHVLVTGEPSRFERALVATGRHLELAAFRLEPPSRRQVAVLFQDITARKRAEAALRDLNDTLEQRVAERTKALLESERRFRGIFDSALQFMALLAPDGTVAEVNETALHWSQIAPADIVGKPFWLAAPMRDNPSLQSAIAAGIRRASAGHTVREEHEMRGAGNVRAIVDFSLKPVLNEHGEPIWLVAEGRDITELKRTEEALRQAQKLEAVGQLTGGVAHDFNNLLTIIKSSTELLRRPDLPDARRHRYVEAISDTVDRASKLTGQLLAFARRQALKPEIFEPAVRVRDIADMVRTIVGPRIRIATEVRCENCFVEADVSQFETALINMVVNARDAMNGEGMVTITIEDVARMPAIRGHEAAPGRYVALSLADTGSGIPPDKIDHIFEPFYTTKEVGKGTGLGLSQVYGFAKQSGGNVAVESEVGCGARFTLYLPAADMTSRDEVIKPNGQGRVRADMGSGCRVLVVEDNVEVGQFSTQILQDLGYETIWAANADEALKLLAEADEFDAVFSDVMMPGMSGVELGQEIRRLYPGLPVVLTSGYSDVLAEEGRHGFDLIKKPYAVEELSLVLSRVTRTA